jgi:hypothetical protein
MTIDDDPRPAQLAANLFLPDTDAAQVWDHGDLSTLRMGDQSSHLTVFASGSASARELAESATVWAELTEARERGEQVELWGGWVLPADTFRGPR